MNGLPDTDDDRGDVGEIVDDKDFVLVALFSGFFILRGEIAAEILLVRLCGRNFELLNQWEDMDLNFFGISLFTWCLLYVVDLLFFTKNAIKITLKSKEKYSCLIMVVWMERS